MHRPERRDDASASDSAPAYGRRSKTNRSETDCAAASCSETSCDAGETCDRAEKHRGCCRSAAAPGPRRSFESQRPVRLMVFIDYMTQASHYCLLCRSSRSLLKAMHSSY